MKGSRFIHPMIEKDDSLSSNEIVELRDDEDVPIWFSRDILKNVCLTGECRVVGLRIYWNGAGNFMGLQISENAPLTKTDHSVFKHEDYKKLDRILSDSVSILKGLKMKDLVIEKTDKNNNKIDANSGATQPSIYEYVVRNAVYTCYTLWHTVYGPTRKNILAILGKRTNKDYLQKLFARKDPQYLFWAIEFIGSHHEYHSDFYPGIISLIKSENIILSQKAVSYFTSDLLKDGEIQKELARVTGDVSSQNKFEIMRKFSELHHINNDAILILMQHYENQQIDSGLLSYVIRLIHSENMTNDQIVKRLKKLSKDKNLYVRNLIKEKLETIRLRKLILI